ncbi:hypothetical protein PSPO01_15947 [Paraphaeosphaeria sporulosa]
MPRSGKGASVAWTRRSAASLQQRRVSTIFRWRDIATMDFCALLDERLREPPKRKSTLSGYFEAHSLFQGTYRTPSPTPSPSPPSPRSSPGSKPATHPPGALPRPRPLPCSTKRKYEIDVECVQFPPSPKRRRTNQQKAALNKPARVDSAISSPLRHNRTSTDSDTRPNPYRAINAVLVLPPPSLPSLSQVRPAITSKTRRKKARSRESAALRERRSPQRTASVKIGTYTLRLTAARLQRGLM